MVLIVGGVVTALILSVVLYDSVFDEVVYQGCEILDKRVLHFRVTDLVCTHLRSELGLQLLVAALNLLSRGLIAFQLFYKLSEGIFVGHHLGVLTLITVILINRCHAFLEFIEVPILQVNQFLFVSLVLFKCLLACFKFVIQFSKCCLLGLLAFCFDLSNVVLVSLHHL